MPIQLPVLPPEYYLPASAAIPTLGILCIFVYEMRKGYKVLSNLGEHWPVLLSFFLLIVGCYFLGISYDHLLRTGQLHHSIIPEFYAALLEDLVFFSCVGIILLLVQHREFYLSRKMEDRLSIIFNAKDLSPDELEDLKGRVLEVGCDAKRLEVCVDIRQHDPENDCIWLDVSRKFLMGSYIRKHAVYSNWRLKLKPDDIPGKSPLMEIFPSRRRIVKRSKFGKDNYGTFVKIHDHKTLNTAEEFISPEERIEIPSGWELEIEARYSAWQRLHVPDGDTQEPFALTANKHWDKCVLLLENNLRSAVQVRLSVAEREMIELAPGSTHHELIELEHFTKDKSIDLRFEILSGN